MLQLQDVLVGEPSALSELQKGLCETGWIFVSIPSELQEAVSQAQEPLRRFFHSGTTKELYTQSGTIFGYQRVPHKESLRWLTHERFREQLFPEFLQKPITHLTQLLDQLMYQLTHQACSAFWNKSVDQIGCDVALFDAQKIGRRFGMLDVAHYLNMDTHGRSNMPPKNCVEHYDPGLFSLSFYSSQPGLQLLDLRNDQWVDGPCNSVESMKNVAIIWCGAAAQTIDSRFKPAVHRVQYPERMDGSAPRMAIWYEICTSAQETDYLLLEKTGVMPPNIFVNHNTMSNSFSNSNSNHIPATKNAYQPKMLPDNHASDLQIVRLDDLDIESLVGVPQSKVALPNEFLMDLEPSPTHTQAQEQPVAKKKRWWNPFSERHTGVPQSKSMRPRKF